MSDERSEIPDTVKQAMPRAGAPVSRTFRDQLEFLLLEFQEDDPDDLIAAMQAAIDSLRSESDDLREIGA